MGAQISAISKSTFDRIVDAKVRIETIPIRKFTLKGAFSDKGAQVTHKAQLEFILDNKELIQQVYVVPKLSYDIVLLSIF